MSERAAPAQDYESALNKDTDRLAEFEDHRTGLIHKLQHALHQTPSLVPLIVLVLSIVIFGALLGS
ncbi:hypothetical protein LCGC14_2028970, partial [marine sediment metagenome]